MRNPEVKIFLLRQGIKQRDLAAHLDVSEAAVSRLLSGHLSVGKRLDQIADYLGLSPRKLNRLIGQSPSTKTTPKEAPHVNGSRQLSGHSPQSPATAQPARRARERARTVRPSLSQAAAVSETALPIH